MSKTITDAFEPYIGTKEYNGIVRDIQVWFYGTLLKQSWCATSVSYFANQIGILDQLGGKNENVYRMMIATEKAFKAGHGGAFYYAKNIPKGGVLRRGTVIFMLHSGTKMTETSSKHVTTAYEPFAYKGTGTFKALGGNQSDAIRVSEYAQKEIYAVFIPDYGDEGKTTEPQKTDSEGEHPTLKRGDKGDEVKTLQSSLNHLGYKDYAGKALAVDGSFGKRTLSALKSFQEDNGLEADGICGPVTWGKIIELGKACKLVTPTTDVYVREYPNKYSAKVGVLRVGSDPVVATRELDGWTFTSAGGWSKSEYLKTV